MPPAAITGAWGQVFSKPSVDLFQKASITRQGEATAGRDFGESGPDSRMAGKNA